MKVKEIIVSSKSDAEAVIDCMRNVVAKFGYATVGDLYDSVGLPSIYADSKSGWTSADDFTFKKIPEGFLLELPPTEVIA